MNERASQPNGETGEVLLVVGLVDADDEHVVGADDFDELLIEISESQGGRIKGNADGDYLVEFDSAEEAIRCALAIQVSLTDFPGGYLPKFGIDKSSVSAVDADRQLSSDASGFAQRLMRIADAGQILMSRAPFDAARGQEAVKGDRAPLVWLAHGAYLFKGVDEPFEIFEAGADGASTLERPTDSDRARRATALTDEPTLGWRPAVGLRIPGTEKWTLQKKIGQGGFGEVWVAEDETSHELRAFKFCFKAERLRTLKRERTLLRLMQETLGDRQDIARLYDVRLDEAPYYLELEYTPGGDLVDWVEQQGGLENIPMEQRLEIVAQVAEALSAANSIGILHKDIKPRNVLIEEIEDGTIQSRLTDFGIGQLVNRDALRNASPGGSGFTTHDSTMQTDISLRSGTRIYMAPEVLAGKPPSIQSDVYALGVLLYQVAVGDLTSPLGQGWQRGIEDELLIEDIAACIDMDPKRRLSDANELARRLRHLEERKTEREQEAQAEATAARAHRRRKVYVTTSAAAALIALAATFVAVQQNRLRGQAEEERERADAQAAIALQAQATAEEEAARATKEEQAAKSVEEFMVDLFQIADPYGMPDQEEMKMLTEARGRSITAGEILDIGARKIKSGLKDQPEVRARLMNTLGAVYLNLSFYDKALPLVEQALELRRERFGEESEEVAESLVSLAGVRQAMGEADEFKRLLEQALEMRRGLYDGDHEAIANSLHHVSDVYWYRSEWNEAANYRRQALNMERRLHTEDHDHVAHNLLTLGAALGKLGDIIQGESMYDEALEIYRRLHGDDHQAVADILSNKGYNKEKLGHNEEALEYFHQALAIRRRLFTDTHPYVAFSLQDLATSHWRIGEFDEAESLYREELEILRKTLGNDEQQLVVNALVNIAWTLDDKGELAEAEKVYWEAIAAGSEFDDEARVRLYEILRGQDNRKGAEQVLLEGLELDRQRLGNDAKELAENYHFLGAHYVRSEDDEAAEKAYREVLRLEPEYIMALDNLTTVLRDRDDLEGAEAIIRETLARVQSSESPDQKVIGRYFNLLGIVLRDKGDLAGAEKAFAKAIELLEPLELEWGPEGRLVALLMEKGDVDRAENILRARLETATQRHGDHWLVMHPHADLAELLAISGRWAEALAAGYTSALGGPAAPISIGEWIKGEPIELKLDKNIYVVDFWATWCPPCLNSIPHLTELQKKYKDKGVMIIGISVEDASTVRPYVEKMGDKMAYTVAVDVKRKTDAAYMSAYGQYTIPTAFIVDKELNIAWVGHPMYGLDTALQEITAGTYDIQAARRAYFAKQNLPAYFNLAKSGSENLARELGEKILAGGAQEAMVMNDLAWDILTKPNLKKRDLDLAMRSAQAAYDACQGKNSEIVGTYARALRDTGDLDKAVEYQKKAVALATNPQTRESNAATLKEYEEELSRQ